MVKPALAVRLLVTWLALILCLIALNWARSGESAEVVVLTLDGAVTPATADYVVRGIRKAADKGAALVVVRLDTPGGLDTSMRSIIKAILASPVPVASFVAPDGARAASAGTYILYASHVAAMAPGTNLGAATPVQIGMPGIGAPESPRKPADESTKGKTEKGKPSDEAAASSDPMTRKQVHDAAAYIRGLAQMRGRNVEWAERAVREAVSLSADEALAQKVIDVVAGDVPDLMAKLDGRRISTAAGERVLDTAHVIPTTVEPDWKSRFLAVITNPSVALILM